MAGLTKENNSKDKIGPMYFAKQTLIDNGLCLLDFPRTHISDPNVGEAFTIYDVKEKIGDGAFINPYVIFETRPKEKSNSIIFNNSFKKLTVVQKIAVIHSLMDLNSEFRGKITITLGQSLHDDIAALTAKFLLTRFAV